MKNEKVFFYIDLPKNCSQCGPSIFLFRFSCFSEKLLIDGNTNEAAEPAELGDVRFDADDVDGVLNFSGENLLSVHDVTVCSKPLCSISERGVRCNEIPVGTAIQQITITKKNFFLLKFPFE